MPNCPLDIMPFFLIFIFFSLSLPTHCTFKLYRHSIKSSSVGRETNILYFKPATPKWVQLRSFVLIVHDNTEKTRLWTYSSSVRRGTRVVHEYHSFKLILEFALTIGQRVLVKCNCQITSSYYTLSGCAHNLPL